MKKTIIALLSAIVMAAALAGCQATPETAIVQGKNLQSIVDSAVSTEKANIELAQPQRLTTDFAGVKGNVKFNVDAEVIVPQSKSIPVARVSRAGISEEDVESFYNTLCGGTSVKVDELPAAYYLELIRQSGSLAAGGGEKYSGADYDNYLAELQAKAASAPADYLPAEADFSFKTVESFEIAKVWALSDNGTLSQLLFKKADGNDTGCYVRDLFLTESLDKAPSTSQADAKKLATETAQKLGFADLDCNSERMSSLGIMSGSQSTSDMFMASFEEICAQDRELYEFMFTRLINGVPITYTDNDGLTVEHDAASRPWMYEKLRIFVDDGGVFAVQWSSPYELNEIVTESSALKKFDEIQAIIQKMLPILYEYKDSDTQYSYQINVSQIKLGLMRVTEKDVGDKGLVIPVWDVFGTEAIAAKTDPTLPLNNTLDKTGLYMPLITVNAIDGSIISRDLGY